MLGYCPFLEPGAWPEECQAAVALQAGEASGRGGAERAGVWVNCPGARWTPLFVLLSFFWGGGKGSIESQPAQKRGMLWPLGI